MKKTHRSCCADAIVQSLYEHGITEIFGYPGAAICPFYDALYLFNKRNKNAIHHVLVRQEQNAGHCASGYARISQKPSVCVATSGPGALNLIPAIACAYIDSIPMIIITGQVSSDLLGRDVFQEADITGSAEPFVKHSYLVRDSSEIMNIMAEAFLIADTGRKGPVLIDIPVDILESNFIFPKEKVVPVCPQGYHTDPTQLNSQQLLDSVEKVKSALVTAKRPLLCVGGGVISANAQAELLEFIERCNLPFVCTMMGISAISPRNSHFLGMLGDYGQKSANDAVSQCDLLFLIGARAGDRAIKSDSVNKKTICHLDIDPCELNKNMQTDIQLNGNAKTILPMFYNYLPEENVKKPYWTDNIKAQNIKAKNNEALSYNQLIFKTIFSKLSQNAIVVSDVGRHLIYCAHEYNLENGRFLTSGGMGTMGYSLPAAVGACLAARERQVVVFCGDGGFQMNMMELATVMREKLPIKLILLDNQSLGLVKELQDIHYNGNEIAVALNDNPDFMFISNAYGIKSIELSKADSEKSREQKIDEFFAEKTACMLICKIDKYNPIDDNSERTSL